MLQTQLISETVMMLKTFIYNDLARFIDAIPRGTCQSTVYVYISRPYAAANRPKQPI